MKALTKLFGKHRRGNKGRKNRRLQVESLEDRRVFCNINFTDGQLIVTGTNSADNVSVQQSPVLKLTKTTVTANCDGEQQTKTDYRALNKITFYGGGGNDTFTNGTSVPSLLFGMGGDDVLIGGNGADQLYGHDGEDVLWGGSGNDSIYGGNHDDRIYGVNGHDFLRGENGNDYVQAGSGNDTVYGDNGNDRLEGNTGNDKLYGGNHNDILYGDEGSDTLSGDAGNDGLYGGLSFDWLKGGTGADRFLTDEYNVDSVVDQSSLDAKIHFDNGNTTLHNGTYYSSKNWTQNEIELVDAALQVMHETAGDTHLLKKSDGTPITFVRRGASQGTDTSVLGWNNGGYMTVLDKSFGSGGIPLNQIIYHEIGHNWDEVVSAPQFRAISSWMAFPTNAQVPSGFIRAVNTDGDLQPWVYSASATFARPYGTTSPHEDFSTAFAAYFMTEEGTPFSGGLGASAIPDKIAYIDTFIV